ncbi:MAG: hypothetical protein AUH27_08345 [Chloroflexi bacterium 13_1_40CM_66_19]|nr:MAG: hypothetical protein AUH27_08345 [Chloroflexi bacterium 13_1_40CM_66_19]
MEAPGGPGAPPMWGTGRKMAFGAAPGSRSKVWYTLADGNLSEVFFPYLDRVALHELRFFVSASGAPPVDDAADGQHSISWISPGVPAFHVDSTHHEYRLTKEFFSDPEENAMLIAATFKRPRHTSSGLVAPAAGRVDLRRRAVQPCHGRLLPQL